MFFCVFALTVRCWGFVRSAGPAVADAVAAFDVQSDRQQSALPNQQRQSLPLPRGIAGRPGISSGAGTGRFLLAALPRHAGGTRPARTTPGTPAVLRLLPIAGGHSAQLATVAVPLRLPLAAYPARGPPSLRNGAQSAALRRRLQRLQRRRRRRKVPHETRKSPTPTHAQIRKQIISFTSININ